MIQDHHVRQNIYWTHCVELLDCNGCKDKTKCMIQDHCVRQNIYWTHCVELLDYNGCEDKTKCMIQDHRVRQNIYQTVFIVQSYQIVMVVKIKLNV